MSGYREVDADDYYHLSSAQEGQGVRHQIYNKSTVIMRNVVANGRFVARKLKPGKTVEWWEPNMLGFDVVIVDFDIPNERKR